MHKRRLQITSAGGYGAIIPEPPANGGKVDLTPLMRQMYNDNLEMAEKLGRLEAQLEMMHHQPTVEIDPADIEVIEERGGEQE